MIQASPRGVAVGCAVDHESPTTVEAVGSPACGMDRPGRAAGAVASCGIVSGRSARRVAAAVSMLAAGWGGMGVEASSPENALLIINPSDPISRHVGNYYREARNLPPQNVLYMDPGAANFPEFVNVNRPALLGMLANRGLDTHIDQIIIAPGGSYFVSAPDIVTDGCFVVRRFSASSPYFMPYIADEVLGGVSSSLRNQYYAITDAALAFDSRTSWYLGDPSARSDARRYFLSTLLGYTGDLGNTVPEVLAMIDRSVAVDGTRPTGTFYYMETTDSARSGPRDNFFDAAVTAIQGLGGQAEHRCCDVLPNGEQDVLGLMTGTANVDPVGANINILPGAFCDHLTSFAANFGTSSQTKASIWIRNGASGTHGAVEEPCNYGGKFPHPRMHVFYYQGLTLAESIYRSLQFVPFQGLVLGDPLTRPFAYLPEVRVPDFPTGNVSGRITIHPEATTDNPQAAIAGFELYLDGRLIDTAGVGESMYIETTRLSDGPHDVRVIARDDSGVRTPGRFVDVLEVSNLALSARLTSSATIGDLSTPFEFTVSPSSGGAIDEIRLLHNGRVVATAVTPVLPIVVYGATFGAGPSSVQAEVWYADGRRVGSDRVAIEVGDDAGSPSALAPAAFGYTVTVLAGETAVIELPATYDDVDAALTYTMLNAPAQATLISSNAGPYRIFTVDPDASGVDTLVFEVSAAGGGTSEAATVDIVYQDVRPGDLHLSVGPLFKGEVGEAAMQGGFPNEATWLLYSFDGEGTRYVPQLNVELGIRNPILAAPARDTNASGEVMWSTRIPGGIRTPKIVWFQAAQRDVVSNVVLTQIN